MKDAHKKHGRAKAAARAENRPDWDTYFLDLAQLVSKRSTCLRRRVGTVIVKERHILSTGYNGAPKAIAHCIKTGCLREKMSIPSGTRHELCRGLHAEQNAIIQAALYGVSLRGSTLYCTNLPCSICAKMIINAGIADIVSAKGYPDGMSEGFFKQAKIKIRYINNNNKSKHRPD